ncbi:hypothetical protein C0Q70_00496 [Pomacea canaliculata]|uniref:Uncharacterized protein n=1 Tax=Pomacea canaliculata TaxID=400727 RepID=A0A2T7PWU3_POMCA|nr:hypothetical protein C0Q70_00496 [Pomacea canaliculata]
MACYFRLAALLRHDAGRPPACRSCAKAIMDERLNGSDVTVGAVGSGGKLPGPGLCYNGRQGGEEGGGCKESPFPGDDWDTTMRSKCGTWGGVFFEWGRDRTCVSAGRGGGMEWRISDNRRFNPLPSTTTTPSSSIPFCLHSNQGRAEWRCLKRARSSLVTVKCCPTIPPFFCLNAIEHSPHRKMDRTRSRRQSDGCCARTHRRMRPLQSETRDE